MDVRCLLSKFSTALFLSALLFLFGPYFLPGKSSVVLGAAWTPGYGYRRAITVDYTKVSGSANFSNFPVLVSVTDKDLKSMEEGGYVHSSDGYDIIFTASDGSTILDHEIEYYGGVEGKLVAWVKVPTLNATTNTVIYMYYSNDAVYDSQENIEGVWSNGFSMVQHLSEGSSGPWYDSTSNNNDGSLSGTPSGGPLSSSIIDGGYTFAIENSFITVTSSSSLTPTNGYTMSAWIKPSTCGEGNNGAILFKVDAYALAIQQTLGGSSGMCGLYFRYGTSQVPTVNDAITQNSWQFVAVRYSGTGVESLEEFNLWVNNTSVYFAEGQFPVVSNSNLLGLGARDTGRNPDYEFDGPIDEIRIMPVARSDDWLITEYNNQGNPSTFYSFGSAEADAAPTISNFSLNGGSDIVLVRNSTKTVNWIATVSDLNGHDDIKTVTGRVFRSGVTGGQNCSLNNNNCYADSGCVLSSCSGNTCTATCTADVHFHAEATDTGSTYPLEYWRASVAVTDYGNNTVSQLTAANTPDVTTLLAVDVPDNVYYGSLLVGEDTGSVNEITTVTNVGNTKIDIQLSGDDLCLDYPDCIDGVISTGFQKYSLTAFTYFTGGETLKGEPTLVHTDISKPTSSPSLESRAIYWGIAIPAGTPVGLFTGRIYFTAVVDIDPV